MYQLLGDKIYPIVEEIVGEFSKKDDWKYRWSALLITMYSSEGCKQAIQSNMQGLPR